MTNTSAVSHRPPAAQTATMATIVETLRRLPPERLNDVLLFVQFLEYQVASLDDASEDAALWDAVQANRRFKEQHPDEPLERYESGEKFLEAVADL